MLQAIFTKEKSLFPIRNPVHLGGISFSMGAVIKRVQAAGLGHLALWSFGHRKSPYCQTAYR